MDKTRARLLLLAVLPVVSLSSGCGGVTAVDDGPQLVAITVTPQIADAQNTPDGVVHFAASEEWSQGNGNVAVTGVMPTWCIAKSLQGVTSASCAGISDSTGAVVFGDVSGTENGTGMAASAHCMPGFTGQVKILAGVMPANTTLSQVNPPPFSVAGSALMTCP